MSNLPTVNGSFPEPTPNLSRSLSSEELGEHRTQIGFEVEVVLSGYWQADMDARLRAAVLADWADELQDWQIGQVKWALREWRRENPRRKPNPGDILRLLMDKRGREVAARVSALPKPEPELRCRDRVSPERVAEILASVRREAPQ